MNILFHHGALGDWVLTFPILRALTGSTLAVASASKARLAARLFPHVTAMDANVPALTALFSPDAPVVPWLDDARLIISFVSDGRDAWADNVRRMAPAARIAFVDPRPPVDWAGHVCDWHRQQLVAQGVSLAEIIVVPNHRPFGPVVIHPGSGGRHKCWPAERYAEVARCLRGRGVPVRVIVGEVECETWEADQLAELDAVACPTLEALFEALREARCFLGNDSGPTHLAGQLGVPTVALFGPTLPCLWRPRGPQVVVLAPDAPQAMSWLQADRVERTVEKCLINDSPL